MSKSKIYYMSVTAIMVAVTCILAPISIPIGPVPISFGPVAMFLALYLLGWKLGTVSVLLYLLIGFVGLPVFTGFTGGIGKLAGPTGGYMVGYIPMVIIAGIVIEKSKNRILHFFAMAAGMLVCYAGGTAWFCISMEMDVLAACSICVFPFIPGDIAKIAIVLLIGPILRKRLQAAGFLSKS